ncbi:MAG: biopolymer transporter ExbD, partial [Thiovulaceae bacterium]|nr:biopolymer transporter ExbD [Sulfurimonadaceae bacterium]
ENFDLQTFGDNFYLYSQKLDKEATVLISADKRLDYGLVMSVLGAVKQAGFTEVSLATSG